MTDLAAGLWERGKEALRVARHDLALSPDAAASRAYYAAFYAVSAHFALRGKTFKKHSAVEAAVHRELVKPGLWPKELGTRYSLLVELRSVSDYGELEHASSAEAEDAVQTAVEILRAIHDANPREFALPAEA